MDGGGKDVFYQYVDTRTVVFFLYWTDRRTRCAALRLMCSFCISYGPDRKKYGMPKLPLFQHRGGCDCGSLRYRTRSYLGLWWWPSGANETHSVVLCLYVCCCVCLFVCLLVVDVVGRFMVLAPKRVEAFDDSNTFSCKKGRFPYLVSR